MVNGSENKENMPDRIENQEIALMVYNFKTKKKTKKKTSCLSEFFVGVTIGVTL